MSKENEPVRTLTDTEFEILIRGNDKWDSWKCRCGCLNRRGNGNCGRCGSMRAQDSMHYGNEVIHGGIWNPEISIIELNKEK
jgi:hypothetical protein